MERFAVQTHTRMEFLNVTPQVEEAVRRTGVTQGLCTVFVPHTTAGVTINENADPDVPHDILMMLDRLIPLRDRGYQHAEGNSAAHLQAMLAGSSANVIVRDGRLQLGTWQGIFFCEFDGPRNRTVWVHAQ